MISFLVSVVMLNTFTVFSYSFENTYEDIPLILHQLNCNCNCYSLQGHGQVTVQAWALIKGYDQKHVISLLNKV